MLKGNSDTSRKMAPSILPEVLSLDVTGVEPSYVKKTTKTRQTKNIYPKGIEMGYMDAYKRGIPVSMTRHPGVHVMSSLQHHDAAPSTRLSEMTSLDYIFQVKAMKTGPVLANGNSQTTISADILRNRAMHSRTGESINSASIRTKGHRVTFKDCPSDPNALQPSTDNFDEVRGAEAKVESIPTPLQEASETIGEEPEKSDLCSSVVVYGSSVVKDASNKPRTTPDQGTLSRRSARNESVHLFKRRWKTFCQVQKFSRPTSNDLLSCISIQSAHRRAVTASGGDAVVGPADSGKHGSVLFSGQSERGGTTGVSSSCSIRSWPFSKSDTNVLFYRSKKHASPLRSHVVFNKASTSVLSGVRQLRLQPTREVEVTSLSSPGVLSAMGHRSSTRLIMNKMQSSQVLQAHKVDAYVKTKPIPKTIKAPPTPGRMESSIKLLTCNGDKL